MGQIVISISNILNELHDRSLTSLFVSSLHDNDDEKIFNSSNNFLRLEYSQQLNKHDAYIREELIKSIAKLNLSSFNDLKFQSSILAHLTQKPNQLTRKASILASNKCHQLAKILQSITTIISYEDLQFLSTNILQCAANVMININGPLQGRTPILDLDLSRIHTETMDDCSVDDDEYQINLCHQKQTANKTFHIISDIIFLITSSINVHLNFNQSLIINTSSIYFYLEKNSPKFLSNRTINQIHLPSILNLSNSFVLLRSIIEPLSFVDFLQIPSNMNYSRSFSFAILNENIEDLRIKTTFDDPIQLFIPRDRTFILPKMSKQNVTNENLLFNYHLFDLQMNFSIHLELQSLKKNISYLLIYKFDSKLPSIIFIENIDGWDLLCASNENEIHTFFLDNNQTANHQSIVFGIRELNPEEMEKFCENKPLIPPMSNEKRMFSSDYQLRAYVSACYYLDRSNYWQSHGLLVGSKTNHYQTQCLSTHLTTFTSALIFLPTSTNDESKNKDLSLVTICLNMIYFGIISFLLFRKNNFMNQLQDLLISFLKKNINPMMKNTIVWN